MDDSFAREVLRLAEGQSIEVYEELLRAQALEFAVSPLPFGGDEFRNSAAFKTTSTSTASSKPRRSGSIGSQASRSTGFTSNFSRTSKEQPLSVYQLSQHGYDGSGTSLSIKDYDSITSHARSDARRMSLNISPPITPSRSTFSLPLSASSRETSPKRNIIRGLSRLKLRRIGSSSSIPDDCPHCPRDSFRSRRALHQLPCGHRYCTSGLRSIIVKAMESDSKEPPSCCDRPILGYLVERVMNQEEQGKLMRKMSVWDEATAGLDVLSETYSADSSSPPRPRFSPLLTALEMEEAQKNLIRAMDIPDFKQLHAEQQDQRNRLVTWDVKRRQMLLDQYVVRKQDASESIERQQQELFDEHTTMIAQVEDKHVLDESDLRTNHETERRNNATALRHMEAYCRGETATGDLHHRTVTDQDLRELARERTIRDQMEARHMGAINVLRGDQNRRMNIRVRKQDREQKELKDRQTRELDTIQREYDDALREHDEDVYRKQQWLQTCWAAQIQIWRKKLEKETGIGFDGVLPPMTWTDEVEATSLEKQPSINASASTSRNGRAIGEVPSRCPPKKRELGISSAFAASSRVMGRA